MVFCTDFGTRFSITVDTEEEFAWGQGFSRVGHGLESIAALRKGQSYFAAAGVTPIYYVDAPVMASDEAPDIFGPLVADGSADVGVHVHPWVTQPFLEDLSSANSYAGNLPEQQERAKIRTTRDLIEQQIGLRPIAYRAGRYGIGPNTLRILAEEGFRCDSSVRSLFDYRGDGGPDFTQQPVHPHWDGPGEAILELPLSTLYIGYAKAVARTVYRGLNHLPSVRSLLARTGIIERIPLTPEGVPANKACDAIDIAMEMALPLLTLSFHSPSLAPGHTPYVRSEADLRDFYCWFDTVLDHFARRGIANANLATILGSARAALDVRPAISTPSGAVLA